MKKTIITGLFVFYGDILKTEQNTPKWTKRPIKGTFPSHLDCLNGIFTHCEPTYRILKLGSFELNLKVDFVQQLFLIVSDFNKMM